MIDTQRPTGIVVPPHSTRFWFWLFGRRLEPLYRPWVGQQVSERGYARRRTAAMAVFQASFVALPNLLIGLGDHDRFRLWFFGGFLLLIVLVVVLRRPFSPATTSRLLAYHGVTADGTLRDPVTPSWNGGPFTRWTGALLVMQLVLVSVGGAVVFDRLEERSRCHPASPEAVRALTAVLGKPGVFAGLNPDPAVPVGARLVRAKQVDQGLNGITFVAAYARVAGRADTGPGVWRVIRPGGVLPVDSITVSAANPVARSLTPSLGYSSSVPADRGVGRAADCVDG